MSSREWRSGTCVVCGWVFRWPVTKKQKVAPETCGFPACRARHEWGPDDWAGRKRMAQARLTAGLPINGLDIEALLTERTRHE